jgi:hypothetical protein
MINTQLADTSIALLTLLLGLFLANYLYRTRQVAVKRLPLALVVLAAMWSLLNMVGHLVAVLWVNIDRMVKGTFTYSFHFYALLLMGVVFLTLNALQLNRIVLMSRGKYYMRKQLTLFCLSLAALSLPLFPLNPIGLLPVICSVVILSTIAITKKQWYRNSLPKAKTKSMAVTA